MTPKPKLAGGDLRIQFSCVCDRGLRRLSNQDRAWADVDHRVFAVCDGVGGSRGGEIASQTAIETLQDAFQSPDAGAPLARLERAVQYANRDIFEMAKHNLDLAGMATTVVAAYVEGRTAYVAHAGDSRLYYFTGGALKQVTVDHTSVHDAVRHGDLSPEEASRIPKTNVISRALGVFPDVEVECQQFDFAVGARLLLCTDGVTRHIPNHELERLMRTHERDPQGLCDEVHRMCYERGAEDNFTALVVCLDSLRSEATDRPPLSPSPERTAERVYRREISVAPKSFPPERTTGSFHPLQEMVEARRTRMRRLVFMASAAGVVALCGAFWAGGRYFTLAERWLVGQAPAAAPTESVGNDALFREAQAEFLHGDLAAAQRKFTALTEREPKRAEYRLWLGKVELTERRVPEALASFEAAVRESPNFAEGWLHVAGARRLAGDAAGADAALKKYAEAAKAAP
jgi:protein phosphatase